VVKSGGANSGHISGRAQLCEIFIRSSFLWRVKAITDYGITKNSFIDNGVFRRRIASPPDIGSGTSVSKGMGVNIVTVIRMLVSLLSRMFKERSWAFTGGGSRRELLRLSRGFAGIDGVAANLFRIKGFFTSIQHGWQRLAPSKKSSSILWDRGVAEASWSSTNWKAALVANSQDRIRHVERMMQGRVEVGRRWNVLRTAVSMLVAVTIRKRKDMSPGRESGAKGDQADGAQDVDQGYIHFRPDCAKGEAVGVRRSEPR